MSDETARVNAEVPAELKREYMEQHEHGELTENIIEMMRADLGLDDEYLLEHKLERLEELKQQREELDEAIDQLESEIQELEAKLGKEPSRVTFERTESFQRLVDLVQEGKRIFPRHTHVQKLAESVAVSPEEIIRAVEDQTDVRYHRNIHYEEPEVDELEERPR